MELLFIRHAIPIRRELVEGVADPELSTAGLEQARRLAEYLASEKLDAIYASPLRRAQETAAPVASLHGMGVTTIDGVAEYDRTSSEYVPVEELKATNDPRWHEIRDGVWTSDEETEEEFVRRVVRTAEEIIDRHAGHRVAVVCHGGVINAYLAHVLGLGNKRGFFYPNYTSIHRVAAARSGERSIVTVNETPHLRGTGLPMGLFQS
ncbi:MAG: histidine phosphatase family protein [Ilumatobacteraceae bacterium]